MALARRRLGSFRRRAVQERLARWTTSQWPGNRSRKRRIVPFSAASCRDGKVPSAKPVDHRAPVPPRLPVRGWAMVRLMRCCIYYGCASAGWVVAIASPWLIAEIRTAGNPAICKAAGCVQKHRRNGSNPHFNILVIKHEYLVLAGPSAPDEQQAKKPAQSHPQIWDHHSRKKGTSSLYRAQLIYHRRVPGGSGNLCDSSLLPVCHGRHTPSNL
jgi:hypothetical protein